MAIKVDSAEIGSGGYRIGGTLAEINIIPLVDVTLVLLLIFMLTAPLMYRGIDVNLPKTAGKPTAVEERMVLTLTSGPTRCSSTGSWWRPWTACGARASRSSAW